jgi:hypothetical protein
MTWPFVDRPDAAWPGEPRQGSARPAGRQRAGISDGLMGRACPGLLKAALAKRELPQRPDAVRLQIESYIRAHIADADLSHGKVAAAHHMSKRTLHRLSRVDAPVAEIPAQGWDPAARLPEHVLTGMPAAASVPGQLVTSAAGGEDHLGRLDHRGDLAALGEAEIADRVHGDGRHQMRTIRVEFDVGYRLTGLDGGDPGRDLVACAQFHGYSLSGDRYGLRPALLRGEMGG